MVIRGCDWLSDLADLNYYYGFLGLYVLQFFSIKLCELKNKLKLVVINL